jgi:hypothetical protein
MSLYFSLSSKRFSAKLAISAALLSSWRDWIGAYASDLRWDKPQHMADVAKG